LAVANFGGFHVGVCTSISCCLYCRWICLM